MKKPIIVVSLLLQLPWARAPIQFEPNTGGYRWIMENYSADPVLKVNGPNTYGWGLLGTDHNDKLWKVYTRELYVNGVQVTSDERKKENIVDISGVLPKLEGLRSVRYDFKKEDPNFDKLPIEKRLHFEKTGKNKLGFLAQNMQKAFPELVQYDENADVYSIDYNGMIPVLVQALKEQQAEIEALKQAVGK